MTFRFNMRLQRTASSLARRFPGLRELVEQRDKLARRVRHLEGQLRTERSELDRCRRQANPPDAVGGFPAGHYYSPIPSPAEVHAHEGRIWRARASLPGIRLNAGEQLDLLAKIAAAQPVPTGQRYQPDNDFFGWGDGLVLRGMLATHRPQRIIEVGSGWSSALILDTRDAIPDWEPELVLIEPNPDRLHALLRNDQRASVTIHETRVQDLDPAILLGLRAGDLLFIDSTHVSKVGSDVNYLHLDILPELAPGVLVHIHDVFWPFEYPRAWIEEGRYWNEDYLLRALLTHNPRWNILLFNDWLAREHHDEAAALLPGWAINTGGSLWLHCVAAPATS